MEKDYFLLEDKKKEIESKFSIKNGWLKIYEDDSKDFDDSAGIYCCLISNDKVEKYSEDYNWPLSMGSEGKPSVYGDNTYKSNDEEGLEPFLLYKSFSLQETSIKYIDVAEEFVIYFRLYEKGNDNQNTYQYYTDLAWGGLLNTQIFQSTTDLSEADRTRIENINIAEDTDSATAQGNPCN